MKLAVIYREKKFIVVVPKDSSVADLKTEIEKVHCALFESSGLTETVTEVQTLTGCVLYGGYKVSSVLSDNDTVIASGATPSNSYTPSPQINAFSSPTHISYHGYNPLDYYSPVLGGHVMSHGVGGSPYTPPQSHIIPPMLGALRMGLFQSPSAKTVASQCPSPQYITRDTPVSQPNQSSSERGDFSRQEKKSEEKQTATAEESESPLGDLSHLPARATPQQKILFSRHTTTAGESTDSAAAGASGVRKRKRTPQKRAQSAKNKPAEVVQQKKKGELEDGKGRKAEGKAGEGDKSVAIEKLQKGGVSGGSSDTALPKEITQQPSTSNLPSQSDSPKYSSEPSASCLPKTKVHTLDHKNLEDGPLSPPSPQTKKRKLSRNAASGGNKTKTKKRSKKVVLEDNKETSSLNDDSSGWTSTDESEGEVDKKNSPPSTGKQLTASGVESVSKPKTLEEKSASKNSSSSSEWESEGDDMDSTASTAAPTTSVASATQKSLDQSQTNKSTKATKPQKNSEPGLKPLGNKREAPTEISNQSIANENKKAPKPHKKPQPSPKPKSGNKRGTPAEMTDSSSDWDWSTDEEEGETDSKSQYDKTSQPTKKQDLKVKKGSRNKSGEKGKTEKAVKGSTESVGGAKESKKKEKSSSESEQGKLLKSWSEASTPSPTKRYTACDGQRLRQKRLEDLKNCSKVSEMAETDKTESALGATGETTLAPENDTEDGEGRGTAEDTHDLVDKGEVNMEVAANDSSKDTEILAPNSVPSDEEVVETLSNSHVSAGDASLATDEVTVIQDSQEMEDTCDYSRSPSPEIPLLRHSSNQPSFTPQQKMQENVTLKTLANSPSTYDKKKKGDTSAGGDGVQKKKNKPSRDHSGSETDLVQNDTSTQKQKKRKSKGGNDGASDNAVEISDGTFSGVSGSLQQLPKISHSSQKGSKGTMIEAEAPPSQGESELGAEDEQVSERKTKRKKRKREVSSLTVVPSSQTDQSEGEGALVIDCDDQVEDEDLDSTLSESQGSVPLTSSVEQNSSQQAEVENESNVTASDQQQSGEEKKKRKKKRKKRRSIAAESAGGDDVHGTSTDAPVKNTEFPADDSEGLEEGMTTDVTSDCSLRQSQSAKKKKNKRKKKEVALSQSQVITKKTTGNPPRSEESEQKGICNDDSGTELDDGGENDISSDREKEKRASGSSPHKSTGPNGGKDGFLKPAVPPSKKSPNSSKVQLSPAAKISLHNRVSPSKLKSGQPKESSLLSVFSVTETEMSSEESSSERVKPSSRANKEKNAKKLNFLSSLGSHGKKISPARPSIPFSRSSLLTPFSSSRLSSETGVRMFSLSHSPRSSARKVKPRISPSKTPSARRKHLDSLSPSLDQLLRESQSGQKAGGESSGKVSVSDLLADGSLWDT